MKDVTTCTIDVPVKLLPRRRVTMTCGLVEWCAEFELSAQALGVLEYN